MRTQRKSLPSRIIEPAERWTPPANAYIHLSMCKEHTENTENIHTETFLTFKQQLNPSPTRLESDGYIRFIFFWLRLQTKILKTPEEKKEEEK